MLTRTTPDDSVTQIGYNEAGFLEMLGATLQGVTATDFITGASYNARGQRESVAYANGVTSSYTYDTATFRLTRLLTTRPGGEDPDKLQDLTYIYDPIGNIVSITDAAHDTLYFNNMEIKPENLYAYDALYRLVFAKGREKLEYGSTSHSDPAYGGIPAGTGPLTQVYEETYSYDAVGNFLELDHAVPADTGESWSRTYDVATDSNRLQSTTVGGTTFTYDHDARGSITDMPHLSGLACDFRDQIAGAVLNGSGDDAVYLYDAGGQRVRKVVRRGANTEVRSYIGGGAYEVYRKSVLGTQTVERQTLHLMDGGRRVAIVDTLTQHPSVTPVPQTVQRYQLDNHLGTACVEVDEDAEIISYEEYHPYGTTAWHASEGDVEVSLKRYRYTGMEKDEETGFAYHGARYYLPWLGRWSSSDPIGLGDGVNRFAYTRSNPLAGADTTGLGVGIGPGPSIDEPTSEPIGQTWANLAKGRQLSNGAFGTVSFDRYLSIDGAEISLSGFDGWNATNSTYSYTKFHGQIALRESTFILYRGTYSPDGQHIGDEEVTVVHQSFTLLSPEQEERQQFTNLTVAMEFGNPSDLGPEVVPGSSDPTSIGVPFAMGAVFRRTGTLAVKGVPSIASGEVGWRPPRTFSDPHGRLTNGTYTLDSVGMAPHTTGSFTGGKSQFLHHTNERQLVLDAASYADEGGLWVGNMAKVTFDDPIGVQGRTGELTSTVNIYRTKTGFVHGAPGSPP